MKTLLLYLFCILAVGVFRANAQAAGASSPDPVVWGPVSQNLQCGLRIRPSPEKRIQIVQFEIKNGGGSPIAVDDIDLGGLASNFKLTNASGSAARAGRFSMITDEQLFIVGRRNVSTIAAGQSLIRGYQVNIDDLEIPGTLAVSFDGKLTPVGTTQAIKLNCGPLSFSV